MVKGTAWIIYNSNLATEKFMDYVHWMQRAADKKNIELIAKGNNELLVTIKNGKPILINGQDGELQSDSFPDFVHFADKDLHLARHLEALGLLVMNSAKAIELCDNKAAMHQTLSSYSIPVPATIVAPKIFEGVSMTNTSHIDAIIDYLELPLIIKEAYGSFGEQVYWINTKEELVGKIKELGGKEYIFQSPVETSIRTDLRLNVVGNRLVAAMKRVSSTDFRANVTAGGKTIAYTPTEEEVRLAIASAKAVGADFAGVDLLLGEDGPLLCEVNSNPHIRSIYECTGIDVADAMMSHMINKIK